MIALVITIIVLIILAGISITMISGQDGILQKAGNAKTAIGQASAEEMVDRAILALQVDGLGSNDEITLEKLIEQINKDNSNENVTAEGTTFPTNILFKNNIKVYVDENFTVGKDTRTIYSEDIEESQIAPDDLFNYEPISTTGANNTKIASIGDFGSLPTKKIKITGIKSDYLNGILEDKTSELNYGITYKTDTFELGDTLVIPYQVEYEGEMYTVTEVDISQITISPNNNMEYCAPLPNIENIIYPNTVTRISSNSSFDSYSTGNATSLSPGNENISVLKKVVLSDNITEIPCAFFSCAQLKSITLPKKLTKIGKSAFTQSKIETIIIPDKVEEIGKYAFYCCSELTTVKISDKVEEIEDSAFKSCYKLTTIVIPDKVKKIGEGAFEYCTKLTTIVIPENVKEIGNYAFTDCSSLSTVYFKGSQEQWNNISIGDINEKLTKAIIIYGYQSEEKNSN